MFHHVKYVMYFFRNFFVDSDQSHIGINLCRTFVEIPGSYISNELFFFFRNPFYLDQFGMDFQVLRSEDHLGSFFPHTFRPEKVVLFVKASQQFQHYRYIFPVSYRVYQCIHDL
ncbi:hypothetical protein D3C86_1223370 [compost metagenome]